MPIYAYRCEACGFAKDVLQKMSDDPLTVCPECQQARFQKQVTAAGFQLKGSGWYVTDFRGGAGASNSNSSPSNNPTNRAENSTENSNPSADNTINGNANSTNANNNANNANIANIANIANDSKAA
ncbi:MAG: zinc ribbon domain-containing protein [Burkholderiales bacterium]|nr:zinc ribbon domain-containing protein [Burkholderiales bacterium]